MVATILLFFVMTDGLVQIIKRSDTTSAPIALVGFAVILVDLVFALIVYARELPRAAPMARTANVIAVTNWALAVVPFLLGYSFTLAGGQQWVYGVGWIVSVALLVRAARRIRRSDASGPSA